MENLAVVLILGVYINDIFMYLYFFSTRAGYAFWRNCRLVVVSKVAVTYSALNKTIKDFSLVVQGFKVKDRLKRWENVVYRAISSILRLISPYLFPFGKHVFMYSMAC